MGMHSRLAGSMHIADWPSNRLAPVVGPVRSLLALLGRHPGSLHRNWGRRQYIPKGDRVVTNAGPVEVVAG